MKLIVGLGNPGKTYALTKHNIGFMCLDYYANQANLTFQLQKKFSGEIVKGSNFILLKPHTYMNLSGESVAKVASFYQIDPLDILVIYDDLDLPMAKLRLRYKGSDGGHKGIRSMQQHLGTKDLKRIKFGIDKHPFMDAKDYVLSKFNEEEMTHITQVIKTVKSIIDDFINDRDFIDIMTTYN
ncbi:MAG: aminoacyl-tRNA hydrolase [Candidatus Izemoplasmataceae bacterium]